MESNKKIPRGRKGRRPAIGDQFDEPTVSIPRVRVPASYRQYLLDEFDTIAGGIRALIEYHRESELAKRLDSADE